MSKFLVYILVCICLLHACSARPLIATTDKENTILLSSKDVTFLTSDISKAEGRIIMSENNGRDDAKGKEDDDENKGNKVIISFQEGAQVKMLRRQSRLILESPSAQHEEEAVNSIENDPVEDVVVMDYAQPHRKPPIHNTKH
ncbi:hypothetical protein K7X08_013119 [Anisodus acutangulus]|uniref:Uncharacterized protein n=1 Tax=Anisodus acutangulus TaxID=402998 RepID=A0A9Q1MFG4_9SOLA|nr:hypothetical protein K7X08_013119 [Anisodus acutangulus]